MGFLTGAPTPPSDPLAAAPAAQAGERLGAHRLVSHLGRGGSGSLWRARREDGHFKGTVTIKLLHLSLPAQTGAERFRREGRILARPTHRHIARLLEAAVTGAGQPCAAGHVPAADR